MEGTCGYRAGISPDVIRPERMRIFTLRKMFTASGDLEGVALTFITEGQVILAAHGTKFTSRRRLDVLAGSAPRRIAATGATTDLPCDRVRKNAAGCHGNRRQ